MLVVSKRTWRDLAGMTKRRKRHLRESNEAAVHGMRQLMVADLQTAVLNEDGRELGQQGVEVVPVRRFCLT